MSATLTGGTDFSQLSNLRQVLAPQYAIMPPAQIRFHLDQAYGEGAADAYDAYLEGIFGDIGNFVKSAAKTVTSAAGDVGRFAAKNAPGILNIASGALQGGLGGARFGLPGIIGGIALGGTGAGLKQYGQGTARDIGGVLSGITGLAGQTSPLGRIGGSLGSAISGLAGGGRGGAAGAAVNALNGILGAVGGGGGAGGALSGLLGGQGGAAGALGSLLGGQGGAAGALGGLAGGRGGGLAGALGGLLGGGSGGGANPIAGLFGGNTAIGQLGSFLQRPETAQALAALNLGKFGRSSIPVGLAQTQIPTAAFPRVMAELAEQAVAEAAEAWTGAESTLDYMTDQEGELVGDPALDRDRAAAVWQRLNEAMAERVLEAMFSPSEATPQSTGYSAENEAFADARGQDEAYYAAMDQVEFYGLPEGEAQWGDAENWEFDNAGDSEGEYESEYQSEYES
jgi:hypothetical protein